MLEGALRWLTSERDVALHNGQEIGPSLRRVAKQAGVWHPERIRIAHVAALPEPACPRLRTRMLALGMMDAGIVGMTLGYAVLVRHGHATPRVLSHEFRHVQQYEAVGSLRTFLAEYVRQLIAYGYAQAPWELDARAHEMSGRWLSHSINADEVEPQPPL